MLERGGAGVALTQAAVLQDEPGLDGEAVEDADLRGPQRPPAQGEDAPVVDPHPGVPGLGARGGSGPSPATRSQPVASSRRASSDTDSNPKVARSRDTTAWAVSSPVSTDCDSPDMAVASARARAASAARREARSTTDATAAAVATKTTRVATFCGSAIVHRPTGGVKNQLRRRNPASAVTRAGSRPPIIATRTVVAR